MAEIASMNIKELHIGMMVLVNSSEPWASDWNGGPYEVVGIHVYKNRFGIENISLLADGQEYDGMQASDLVLYNPTCELCGEIYMECDCEYDESGRIQNDGSAEQLLREIQKLKKTAHEASHIWNRTSSENCEECNLWKPKKKQESTSLLKKILSPLRRLTKAM